MELSKKRFETKEEIDLYLEFIKEVKNTMDHPEWLGDFTKKELLKLLNEGMIIWGYYDESNLASTSMLFPFTAKNNKDFNVEYEPNECMDYGVQAVKADHRGMSIQKVMLLELDDYCKENNIKRVFTTVHPDNIYSIRNILTHGFELINQKKFKRGDRNIYQKNLE